MWLLSSPPRPSPHQTLQRYLEETQARLQDALDQASEDKASTERAHAVRVASLEAELANAHASTDSERVAHRATAERLNGTLASLTSQLQQAVADGDAALEREQARSVAYAAAMQDGHRRDVVALQEELGDLREQLAKSEAARADAVADVESLNAERVAMQEVSEWRNRGGNLWALLLSFAVECGCMCACGVCVCVRACAL